MNVFNFFKFLKLIGYSVIFFAPFYVNAQTGSIEEKFKGTIKASVLDITTRVFEQKYGVSRSEFDKETFRNIKNISKDFAENYLKCFSEGTGDVLRLNILSFQKKVIDSGNLLFDEVSDGNAFKDAKEFQERLSSINQADVARCNAETIDQTSEECFTLKNDIEISVKLPLISRICTSNGIEVANQNQRNRKKQRRNAQ